MNTKKYTMTFDREQLNNFRGVLSRLEEGTYTVIKPVERVNPDDTYSDYTCEIETDPESCLTFRMGMKNLKIRRERTEEELAKEKEIEDRHRVTITVQVPPDELK